MKKYLIASLIMVFPVLAEAVTIGNLEIIGGKFIAPEHHVSTVGKVASIWFIDGTSMTTAVAGGGGGGGGGVSYFSGSGFVGVSTMSFPGVFALSGTGHTTFYLYASTGNYTASQIYNSTVTFSTGAFFGQQVEFSPIFDYSPSTGSLHFTTSVIGVGNLNLKLDKSSPTLQIGKESWVDVWNANDFTIGNGSAVYVSGSSEPLGLPTIGLANSNSADTSRVIGLATEDIAPHTYGKVTQFGLVRNLNIPGLDFSIGDSAWLSNEDGVWTSTTPVSPNLEVLLGYIVSIGASSGSILVTTIGNTGGLAAGEASEVSFPARKGTAGTISRGQAVVLSGYNNGLDLALIQLADADDSSLYPAIGIARDEITNTQTGRVIVRGRLDGIDTSFTSATNDPIFLSATAGGLSATRPSGVTDCVQTLARALRVNASAGVIDIVGAGRCNDVDNLTNSVFSTTSLRIDELQADISTHSVQIDSHSAIIGGLNSSTQSIANRPFVISIQDSGSFEGNATVLNFGTNLSNSCAGSTCTITGTASGGGGGGGGGFTFDGTNIVAFSTISFPGADITADGEASTVTYMARIFSTYTAFTNFTSTAQAVGISTQNIQAFFAGYTSTADARFNGIFESTNSMMGNIRVWNDTTTPKADFNVHATTADQRDLAFGITESSVVAISISTGDLKVLISTKQVSFTISSPTLTTDINVFQNMLYDITITSIAVDCSSGTSITWALYETTDGALDAQNRIHNDHTVTCGTHGFVPTISNPVIDAGDRIQLFIHSVSGLVHHANWNMLYKVAYPASP